MSIDIYLQSCDKDWIVDLAVFVSGLFLLVTFLFLFKKKLSKRTLSLLLVFWAIAPPVWFWFEFHYLYRECAAQDSFDYFKYSQQVSVAIWAGVVFCITALLANSEKAPNKRLWRQP